MSSKSRLLLKQGLPVCIITIVTFLGACTDKIKSNLIPFEELDESLVNSNRLINNETVSCFKDLEEKMSDPATAEKVKILLPRAKRAADLSRTLMTYIENLKLALKEEAGGSSFREADKNAVMRLFEKKEKGAELYGNLKKYKDDIIAIDSQMSSVFNEFPVIITLSFDSTQNKQDEFIKTFFDDIPAIAALAMLTRFENNVKITEHLVVEYFNNNVPNFSEGFDTYAAIITQSSNIVKANDKIDITAGIGSFSKAALPQIVIDGKEIEINSAGAAIYSFKANSKAGKYMIPVKIRYKDETGQDQTVTRNIEYTVVENKP